MFERRYSAMVSSPSFIVQPAAERSAEASESSKACSTVNDSKPSISRILPENMFSAFFLDGEQSLLDRVVGYRMHQIAQSDGRGCMAPLKRTKTDSGISNGITPVAAANATSPDPAGKEMPIGNRVWESPPVPTVSGSSMRFSQLWMMPSPGRRRRRHGS